MKHSCMKIYAKFFWLGPDNIDCNLQFSILDVSEEVAYFGTIVHATVAIFCKALHDGMLLFVECNILVPTS